jgi:hypothetical protein
MRDFAEVENKDLAAAVRAGERAEIAELSPELRERLAAAGLEAAAVPRVWLRCKVCGAIWTPHMRRRDRAFLCPNGCNDVKADGR